MQPHANEQPERTAQWAGKYLPLLLLMILALALQFYGLESNYFAVIHLFLTVNRSVFTTRLPSLIFALLTIPMLYVVGKTIFAGLFLAAEPIPVLACHPDPGHPVVDWILPGHDAQLIIVNSVRRGSKSTTETILNTFLLFEV